MFLLFFKISICNFKPAIHLHGWDGHLQFYVILNVFQSYVANKRVIVKGYVARNPVYDRIELLCRSHSQLIASLVGQHLTH